MLTWKRFVLTSTLCAFYNLHYWFHWLLSYSVLMIVALSCTEGVTQQYRKDGLVSCASESLSLLNKRRQKWTDRCFEEPVFCLVYYSGILCKKETSKSEALLSREYDIEYWLSEFSELPLYHNYGKNKIIFIFKSSAVSVYHFALSL